MLTNYKSAPILSEREIKCRSYSGWQADEFDIPRRNRDSQTIAYGRAVQQDPLAVYLSSIAYY